MPEAATVPLHARPGLAVRPKPQIDCDYKVPRPSLRHDPIRWSAAPQCADPNRWQRVSGDCRAKVSSRGYDPIQGSAAPQCADPNWGKVSPVTTARVRTDPGDARHSNVLTRTGGASYPSLHAIGIPGGRRPHPSVRDPNRES